MARTSKRLPRRATADDVRAAVRERHAAQGKYVNFCARNGGPERAKETAEGKRLFSALVTKSLTHRALLEAYEAAYGPVVRSR
jgi:hypothetical protein